MFSLFGNPMKYSRYTMWYSQSLAIFVFLLVTSSSFASVQAMLDRSTIYEGEVFTLTITSDGAGRDMPDLSLLEKDFQILGTGSSQQMQVINGAVSSSKSWNIQLQPKSSGQLHIPSLRIGKELTNPIQIMVTAPPEISESSKGQPVFIEVETALKNQQVYLQQQILYTVRLVFERPLLDGSLSAPAPENAMVEQIGEDRQRSINRGGRSYKVIERTYAIFPEKSGQLVIPPIRFSGRVASPPARRQPGSTMPGIDPRMKRFFGGDPFSGSGFDSFFDRGKPLTLQSKAIAIDVLPRPQTNSTGSWLPAAELDLQDSWAQQPPEFKAGEPVSRTITITAKGLLATLLPKLEIADVDGVSIYPEQPVNETRTDGSWVYGISKQSISYMPTKAGTVEFPELQLSWWDTEAGIERTAVIPKWTVEVLPGKGLSSEPAAQPVARDEPGTEANEKPDTAEMQSEAASTSGQKVSWSGRIQEYWLVLLLSVIAVAMSLYWIRRKSARKNPDSGEGVIGSSESPAANKQVLSQLKQKLKKACSENDARSAAAILLEMAAMAKPETPPKTLPALAAMLEHGSGEINDLDRYMYASAGAEWNGNNFYEAFKDGLVFKAPKTTEHEALAPLYPG